MYVNTNIISQYTHTWVKLRFIPSINWHFEPWKKKCRRKKNFASGKTSIRTQLWSTLKTCLIIQKESWLRFMSWQVCLITTRSCNGMRRLHRVLAFEGTDAGGSTHWWCDSAGWCFYDILQWHEQTQNGLIFSEKMNTVLISKLVKQEHAIKGDLSLISLISMNKYDILYLDVIGHGHFPITMPSIQPTHNLFDRSFELGEGAILDFNNLYLDLWIVIYISYSLNILSAVPWWCEPHAYLSQYILL